MVKGRSTELGADGIRVNCVAPGWVATDMSAPALNDPSIRERIFKTIPLGRVATPEEIAAPILFLCSEHAGFITGEIFNVNGGAVLVGLYAESRQLICLILLLSKLPQLKFSMLILHLS